MPPSVNPVAGVFFIPMPEISELEDKGIGEAFDLLGDDIYEAKYNILGYFETLYKISQRLKLEAEAKRKEQGNG